MVESKITENKTKQRTWGQIKKKNANKQEEIRDMLFS